FINTLPIRDKPFAVAGALAVLRLPASAANVQAQIVAFLVEQQRVIRFAVGEGLAAGLAAVRPGLDVPLVHQSIKLTHASRRGIIAKDQTTAISFRPFLMSSSKRAKCHRPM